MIARLTESVMEDAALHWLGGLGYEASPSLAIARPADRPVMAGTANPFKPRFFVQFPPTLPYSPPSRGNETGCHRKSGDQLAFR
jgi:hypothetical protein